ncbi:MAG: endonuclease V [Candidatus Heimdallarchaeota archaeon]|nr:endonuclease V [Candidatus Heimdallarchaeota archaeon]MCG3253222.1 endonuclease V [Candidatus Heimdallarchaeota archaeon]MCK4290359.1 endonuclease V [Candidatus Heimdallarchaeota archaeon]
MTDDKFLDIPKDFRKELIPVRQEQVLLSPHVLLDGQLSLEDITLVAGLDVAYSKDDKLACASLVVVDFRTLEPVEEYFEYFQPAIPYIPSFLYYRESPGYHSVIKHLEEKPDLFLFDGNGIIHPYGIGLASQMGLEIKRPTVGIAKKLLLGEYIDPLKKGGYSQIVFEEKVIGAAFQSADPPAKPIFLSQGHLINLNTTIYVIREFFQNQIFSTKLPVPLLLADKLAREKLGERE